MKATIEVVNRMETEGIIGRYALAGGVGATFYLEPSATVDIDIFVTLKDTPIASLPALTPVYDYLNSGGYTTENEYTIIEEWPVQFHPPRDSLDEEALQQAFDTEVEEVRTRVMSAEHLVAIALKSGRAKDFARILQFMESGVLDSARLDHIFRRHDLLEKWGRFRAKFLQGGV